MWKDIKHFKPHEFTCKCGCGICRPSPTLVQRLENARVLAGIPFVINSGCRCVFHNKNEDGTEDSSHITTEIKYGEAVDIVAKTSRERYKILRTLMLVGFTRIKIMNKYIHCDIDREKPDKLLWLHEG